MDFVQQVKQAADIVDVVGDYVRLKRAGAGPRYVGLCPFHTEKTASFSVHGAHQFYKCFGCGAGGDVFRFLMEIEGLSFWEALTKLAQRYGIPVPRRTEMADQESRRRAVLYEMHEAAAQHYCACLWAREGEAARAYLERRGVTAQLAREFRLGFSPPSGQALVRLFQKAGYPEEFWEASGLVLRRTEGSGYFDRFRGRLMFPIESESGRTIAFGGRALGDEQPKYLNSPETEIYRKSSTLYNLSRAREAVRRQDRGVLVEGYMDVIGAWSAGVREVVASCGTSLTNTQVRSLRRHSTNIVVNFDPDAAGSAATERSILILLEEGMQVRVLQLEDGLDPDEYVRRHGAETYRARLEAAPDYFTWMTAVARKKFDTHTASGRVAAFQYLLPSLAHVTDKIARAAIASEVAAALQVDRSLVLEQFRKLALDRRGRPSEGPPRPTVPDIERLLLFCLLSNAETRSAVLPRLHALGAVEGFETRAIFETLIEVYEQEGDVTYGALEARLTPESRALLDSLLLSDDFAEETASLEQAESCLRKLESSAAEARRKEIRRRIQEAERAGDLEAALRLTQELDQLR